MENDLKKYDMTEHCQNCGNNFLNKKVLQGHNRAFVTEHRRKVLNKEETVECIQGYMLEILSVGHIRYQTAADFRSHVLGTHKPFAEEIAALKSLQKGEEISLKLRCKFCEKRLMNGHVLKSHFEKVHRQEENKKIWECEFCKKKFKPDRKRRSLFAAHMRDEHDWPEYN